jgi:hypothetical protein
MDSTPNLLAIQTIINARRFVARRWDRSDSVLTVALWAVTDGMTGAELQAGLLLIRLDIAREDARNKALFFSRF